MLSYFKVAFEQYFEVHHRMKFKIFSKSINFVIMTVNLNEYVIRDYIKHYKRYKKVLRNGMHIVFHKENYPSVYSVQIP